LKNILPAVRRSISLFVVFCLFPASNLLHAQWIKSSLPSNATYVYSIVSDGSNIFAGTWGGAPGSNLYLLSDNVSAWAMVDSGSGPFWVDALAMSGSNLLAGTYGSGIFISADSGKTMTAVDSGLTDSTESNVSSLAVSGSNIFSAISGNSSGTHGGDVFLSTNNGASWTPADSGLPSPSDGNNAIFALAAAGENIFAATGVKSGFTVYRSTNNGTNWIGIDSNMTNYGSVRSLAVNGSDVFAGTDIGDVLFSPNGGTSWVPIDSGLAGGVYAIQPVNGSNVFVGTASGGDGGRVYLLTNSGTIWDTANTGLRTSYVLSLAINGGYLFAGTFGGGGFAGDTGAGVWKRSLTGMITAVKKNAIETPSTFSLSQNYPNPFNPTTTISFTLPSRSFVSLKIFDVLGREVSTIVYGELQAGTYNRQWNATNMASGVYFYRMQAGSYVNTKKLLLLK
jgi:hypothetical protein